MGQAYCLECHLGGTVKVLLINDSSSNPNWGDRAAAIALKRMILEQGGSLHAILTEDDLTQSRFFETRPKEFFPQPHKRTVREWINLLETKVIHKLCEKLHIELEEPAETRWLPHSLEEFEASVKHVFEETETFGPLIKAIEGAELVMVHGNGGMVGDGIFPRTLLFLAYLAKTRFSKPVALVNHTADLENPILNEMASAIYPMLDDVAYRDELSVEKYRDRWPGRYAADTAFLFVPASKKEWVALAKRPTYFDVWPDQAVFNPERPYICVGGSSIYSFDGPVQHYVDGFIALARHLQEYYDGQVVLTASDIKDQTLLRPVACQLNLPLVGLTTPVQQVVDILGNAQAYIGGRWHPSIFALRGGAPVIPLASKTFKMQALAKMAGLATPPYNPLELADSTQAIWETLDSFLMQGERLRQRIRCWAKAQAESSRENIKFLIENRRVP